MAVDSSSGPNDGRLPTKIDDHNVTKTSLYRIAMSIFRVLPFTLFVIAIGSTPSWGSGAADSLNRVGRWIGCGYSDGYHKCATRPYRLRDDLPIADPSTPVRSRWGCANGACGCEVLPASSGQCGDPACDAAAHPCDAMPNVEASILVPPTVTTLPPPSVDDAHAPLTPSQRKSPSRVVVRLDATPSSPSSTPAKIPVVRIGQTPVMTESTKIVGHSRVSRVRRLPNR